MAGTARGWEPVVHESNHTVHFARKNLIDVSN